MTADSKVAQSAIDFHGLNQLRYQAANQQDDQDTLRQVAAQFESLFVNMMLKSMREAKLAEGIFDSTQSKLYQDMADQQLASDLSVRGGLGLQDVILRQLGGQVDSVNQAERHLSMDNIEVRPALGIQVSRQVIEQIQRIAPDDVLTETSRDSDSMTGFSSPEDFVEKLWPMAKDAAEKIGVAPEVILSQAALETGWGQYILTDENAESSFNLFNIKADTRWHGDYTTLDALEYRQGKKVTETSRFRQYDSFQQSFDDYISFLQTQPRYRNALEHVDDPELFIELIHEAGYATDPNYAEKVKRIMNSDTLAQISL